MKAVPDTNVWIEWFAHGEHSFFTTQRHGRFRVLLATIALQELWAGTRSAAEREYLERIHALARRYYALVNPPGAAWILAGQALNLLGRKRRLEPGRLRAMRNDVLLAATAFAHQAAVLTHNREDFALIAEVLPVRVVAPGATAG